MGKILTDAILSCEVVIYEPAKPGQMPSVKLYHSVDYPELKPLLEAKINLKIYNVGKGGMSLLIFKDSKYKRMSSSALINSVSSHCQIRYRG